MMSGVSRLPAGFATALLTLTDASRSLFSRQPVGRFSSTRQIQPQEKERRALS
jgi:hypothetical protein